MRHFMASFQTSQLQCAMNELSNHDHSRFLTRTNHKVGRVDNLGSGAASENINKGIMKEAVVVQMTWPGAPTVYYGDEVGVCGFTDPDNRRTYPWGNEDRELLEFHKEMIRIHKENQALRTGSVKFMGGDYQMMCYGRFNREQQFVVVLNNDEVQRTMKVSVWAAGLKKETKLEQIMYTTRDSYSVAPVIYEVHGGYLNLSLPAHSSVVLKNIG